MSKRIDTAGIANELATGSLFFGENARPATSGSDEVGESPPSPPVLASRRRTCDTASSRASTVASTGASDLDSRIASEQASQIANTQADSLASTLGSSGDLADAIYRVVKKPGKQPSFVRVTEREKAELAAILAEISEKYGYKVSETELVRIATCTALADYAQNGIDSLLMRVIIALRD